MTFFTFKRTIVAFAFLSSGLSSQPGLATDLNLTANFSVSFLGINVGKMTNALAVSGDSYKISGVVKSNSLVSVVANTSANYESIGWIRGLRAVPSVHTLKYRTNKKRGDMRMAFTGGHVQSVSATPKIIYKPGSVPVEDAHLQSVLDPVSSLLFPVKAGDVGNGRSVCNRTLPIFDGKSRINLVFSYKSSQTRKAKGFKGETFTCAVRYQPISGIRPKKKNIRFMKANRDMEVTMARVGESNIYALFAFRVKTDKGTAAGKAYKFIVR